MFQNKFNANLMETFCNIDENLQFVLIWLYSWSKSPENMLPGPHYLYTCKSLSNGLKILALCKSSWVRFAKSAKTVILTFFGLICCQKGP